MADYSIVQKTDEGDIAFTIEKLTSPMADACIGSALTVGTIGLIIFLGVLVWKCRFVILGIQALRFFSRKGEK